MEVQWFALTVPTEAELCTGPEACPVRLPITVVNVEPVSVSPESLATCSRCTQPLTLRQLGWTPAPRGPEPDTHKRMDTWSVEDMKV